MLYTKTLALALIASAEAFTLGGMGRTPQRTAGVRMAERVQLDPAVLERYTNLPVKGKVQAEYVYTRPQLTTFDALLQCPAEERVC